MPPKHPHRVRAWFHCGGFATLIFAIIPTSCETAVCSEEAACNFASNLDEVMGSLNQSIVVEDAGMRNGVCDG